MTNVDEFELRRAARDLGQLFRELDAKKYERGRPPEVRVMKPGFGPRDPANMFLMSLDRDLTARLFEYARDAANHIEPATILHHHGPRLCEWLALKAHYIADLDFAADILDELHDQARRIGKRVNPPDAGKVANSDPYLTADSIQRSLTNKGMACPEATVRSWASRGKVATKQRRDGRTAYSLNDIISRLTSDK